MRPRFQKLFLAVVLGLGVASCGGGVKVYRGTMGSSGLSGVGTSASNTTGYAVQIVPGSDVNEWIVFAGGGLFSLSYTATAAGTTLTFSPGQALTTTSTSGTATSTTTVSLVSGSGTLSPDQLIYAWAGTITSTSGGTNTTNNFTMNFNGTRE